MNAQEKQREQDNRILLDQQNTVQFAIIGEMGTAHRRHRVLVEASCFSSTDETPIGERAEKWTEVARDVKAYVRLCRNNWLPLERQFQQVYP